LTKLVVRTGAQAGMEFPVDSPILRLGRAAQNDIVLQDALVSRQHAEIWQREHEFLIRDLASTHGTMVNNLRIAGPHALQPGDHIRLGKTLMTWEVEHRAGAPATSGRRTGMKCYYHREADAVASCKGCGKALCAQCAIDVGGRQFCQQCLADPKSAPYGPADSVPMNTLAIVSFALGILGILGCCCGGTAGAFVFGVPTVITGWIARKQLVEAGGKMRGQELAMVGLALGIGEVAVAIVAIVALLVLGGTFGFTSFWSDLYNSLPR
jgi:hypothetical protein